MGVSNLSIPINGPNIVEERIAKNSCQRLLTGMARSL